MRVRTSAGAGLIEVLVALLVLSIGSLGLARLHIAAKRAGYEALQRTAAAAAAMAILERMRANPAELAAYHSPGPVGEAASIGCAPAGCDAGELAARDLQDWRRSLGAIGDDEGAGLLVQPAACVLVDGPLVTVAISWEGFRPLSAPTGEDCGPATPNRQRLQLSAFVLPEAAA